MIKSVFVFAFSLLLAAKAQDSAPSITDSIADNNVIDPLEHSEDIEPLNPLPPIDGEGAVENLPHDFIISWQARRSLRKILAQMPCGWPDYGVPPLAPYVNEDFKFNIENSVLKTSTGFSPIRIDGLNDLQINRLNIGVIFKRVNFDFNFPNITFTGNFETSTTLNFQEIMNTRFFAKGSGKLNLSLQNLHLTGNLKYKLPIFVGSAQITKVNAQVSLGNVSSELSGFINGVPIGGKVNDFIITNILKYLNEHDYLWNGLIEKHVLPVINSQLEGQTLWKIFWWSIARSDVRCAPGELTESDILELNQLLLRRPAPLVKKF